MSNPTDERRHIGALDGLRALASLAVLGTHVGFATGTVQPDLLGSVVARLDVGVPIFFALSGFLLARPWLAVALGLTDRGPRLGAYAWRRFARIAPAYWLVLGVVLLIASQGWIRAQFASDLEVSATSVATHAIVGQGYSGDYFSNFAQTWSLTTEISFYLLLPLLGFFLIRSTRSLISVQDRYRRVRTACLAAIGLGFLIATYSVTGLPLADTDLSRSVLGHAAWFATGVWAAARHMAPAPHPVTWSPGPGDSFALAAVCLLIASSPLGGPLTFQESSPLQALVREVMFTAVAALTLTAAITGDATSSATTRFLTSRPMRWLGDRSYALFLWHLPVLYGVMTIGRVDLFEGSFIGIGAITLVLSVLVSDLSWRFVEAPILAVVHRRTQLRDKSAEQEQRQGLGHEAS